MPSRKKRQRDAGRPRDGEAAERASAGGAPSREPAPEKEREEKGDAAPSGGAGDAQAVSADVVRDLEDRLRRAEEALKRERADFLNYRRRVEEEMARLKDDARRDVLTEMFSFLDSFFSAEKGIERHEDFESLKEAFRALGRELRKVLEEWKVEVVGEVGERFDPGRHEVVFMRPSEGEKDVPVIDEVVRPGYLQGGRVVRTAQVVVKQRSGGQQQPSSGE